MIAVLRCVLKFAGVC